MSDRTRGLANDRSVRSSNGRLPLVEPIEPAPDAGEIFLALADLPHVVFFDSARRDPQLGRYSFIAADPFDFFTCRDAEGNALSEIATRLAPFVGERVPGLPSFQGGAAGVLSYELGRQLEDLPAPAFDEFAAPCAAVGFYDVVVACDHRANQVWLISQGFPELEPAARHRRAADRLRAFRERLKSLKPVPASRRTCARSTEAALNKASLAPHYSLPHSREGLSNFSRDGYLRAVERVLAYIHAGDVFQVNLAQRLLHPATDDTVSLYLRLRERNPATFAGYFDMGPMQVASASPERFLQVEEGRVEARPIKGTRPRTAWPEADLFAGDELRASEKDRAENVMIVDLLRNDLSRVCAPESVEVGQLCQVEVYQYVQHLVSQIHGRLREDCGPVDLLRAAFPGGSITGAPKIRAMEIIAELERVARGPYCGSLGYIGFDGTMDTNILIRTFVAARGWWQSHVGGGIVAQSSPEGEYEETWDKAAGLLRALA